MILTNKYNIPTAAYNKIKESLSSNPYPFNGNISFRVTELLDSPFIKILWDKYSDTDRLVLDASDYMFILFGINLHQILDDGNNTEVRMSLPIDFNGTTVTLNGTADYLLVTAETITIRDNKVTSCSTLQRDTKRSYVEQQNVYLYMARCLHGKHLKGDLALRLFLRDHNPVKSAFNSDVPVSPYVEVPIEDMGFERQESLVMARLGLHLSGNMEKCSAFETNFGRCAVVKRGHSRALRAFDSVHQAEKFIENLPDDTKNDVDIEPRGDNIKCKYYCKVRCVCPYATIPNTTLPPNLLTTINRQN